MLLSLFYSIALFMLIIGIVSRFSTTTAFSYSVRSVSRRVSSTAQQPWGCRHYYSRSNIKRVSSSSPILLRQQRQQQQEERRSEEGNKDDDSLLVLGGSRRNMLVNSFVEGDTLDPCVVLMSQIVAKHEGVWKEKNDEIYSLAQGVVYWSPPEQAYQALQEYQKELHLYAPDEGWHGLRAILADKLTNKNGLSSEYFMVTSGANQAYMNTVITLMDNKKSSSSSQKAVFFVPYYFNHVMAVQMVHGNDAILLGPVDMTTGHPDLEWLKECILSSQKKNNDDISMVTLVNPGNPTGVTLPVEIIQQIATICQENNIWLVLDHTYEDFHYNDNNNNINNDNEEEEDRTQYFPNLDNVIHIFSMSKGYAMAGFRIGYVVLPTEKVYDAMMKVQDTIAICAPKLSQVAAMGALQQNNDSNSDWVSTRVQSLVEGRNAIVKALKPLPQTLGGSGAMYVMAKLPEHIQDDVELASDLVQHHGVAVIPGSFCGLPGWIRVCYGNLPPEKCLIAAKRLANGIQKLCFADE